MLKYCMLWFPMLLMAIGNGALRDLVYKKYVGELSAHQLSTFSLILFLGMYISYIIRKFPPTSYTQE